MAAPALAVEPGRMAVAGSSGVSVRSGTGFGNGHHGGFRHRRGYDGFFVYDRDYQGDTAWRSDSFNDWWHEQPERSYPRWMLNNQNCEKQWYQGDILRC
jgi:hypothetical protein